ncbi:MAG: hypothetical protein JWP97_4329 [Labilithrix sp.]|nr:hypothetical protein [Labilithrix sp.]
MRRAALTVLACAAVWTAGCKHHEDVSTCGAPHLGDAAYAAGVGWGVGWSIDPGYPYGGGVEGWYDPGDDYDPTAPEPAGGWDANDEEAFPGTEGDPSGGWPADDGYGDTWESDDGSGWDTGDDGSGTTDPSGTSGSDARAVSTRSVRLAAVTSSGEASGERDGNGCYTCTVGCRTGTDASAVGRQATGASSYSYASACRNAVHRVEQWAHAEQHVRLESCQTLVPAEATATPPSRTPADPAPAPGR